ncbi:unnamed protein product [Moneuplotes crassus]|uniref:TFIIF beta subunit HTH domain-containing protein n=1 Tax=Euplotes crassus TaxID=5936 RepID=A0AAD1XPA9_EUPCR|nr:unnamed protein product [Moneuplotes crassus]
MNPKMNPVVKQKSVTLISIPEDIYFLIDHEQNLHREDSSEIGEIEVLDDKHLSFAFYPSAFTSLFAKAPVDRIQTEFTAKITDISNSNKFIMTEGNEPPTDQEGPGVGEEPADEGIYVRAQSRVNFTANLIPNALSNFSKYSSNDPVSSYGTCRDGVIKEHVDGYADVKNVLFSTESTEMIRYGMNVNDRNLMNKHRIGKKIVMDDTVLTREILTLFKTKDQYKLKEIAFLLQQSENRVRRCLKTVAMPISNGIKDYIWELKEIFKNEETL